MSRTYYRDDGTPWPDPYRRLGDGVLDAQASTANLWAFANSAIDLGARIQAVQRGGETIFFFDPPDNGLPHESEWDLYQGRPGYAVPDRELELILEFVDRTADELLAQFNRSADKVRRAKAKERKAFGDW